MIPDPASSPAGSIRGEPAAESGIGVRIVAHDDRSWLHLAVVDGDDPYAGLHVAAFAEFLRGRFDAVSGSVLFNAFGAFVDTFDRFILDRSLIPLLTDHGDSFLRFRSPRARPVVMLEFAVATQRFDSGRPTCFRLEGSFEVAQDRLMEILDGLRRIARYYRSP